MSEQDSRSRRKRQATVARDSRSPVPKRSHKSSEADSKQHLRKIIKAIYRRYNVLSNAEADGRHLAFDALLDACEGEPAARRLAARLIPRFAAQFQGKHSMVARSLMELSAWDSHNLPEDVQVLAQQARLDAFQGLGTCCLCSADDPSTDRTSASVILHLLRCLHQPKGFAKDMQQFPEHASVLAALHQIFEQGPRTMLSACFDSLSSGSGELYDSAYEALDSIVSTAEFLSPNSAASSLAEPAVENGTVAQIDTEPRSDWTQDRRLADWIVQTVSKLKGKSKTEELTLLYERLIKTVSRDLPPAKAEPEAAPDRAQEPRAPPTNDSKSRPEQSPSKPRDRRTERSEKSAVTSPGRGKLPILSAPQRQDSVAVPRAESGELDLVLPNESDSPAEEAPRPPPEVAPRSEPPGLASQPPAVPLSPDALPRAGAGCCLAFECLLLNGIQAHMVNETQIKRVCEEFGMVKRVVFMYAMGQAFVFFHEMSDAISCYEGMNGKAVLSRKPISIDFCEDSPEVASQSNGPLRLAVWLALFNPQQQLEQALNELRSSGVPSPTKVVNVGGTSPGVLLYFSTGPAAAAAVVALRSSATRSPVRRSRSPVSRRSLSPRRPSPGRVRSPGRSFPASLLPDFANRTLWIGQVGADVQEDELIDAFKQHGRLVGYKLIRGSNCGFIDFERVEDAASARAALHEATFASCQIRVEFKEEGRALGRLGPAAASFAPRGGAGGRFVPRGRGRGRGRFDAREPWPAGPPSPTGFRGRGRFPFRGGRGRHQGDWNDGARFDARSPRRSPSPFGSRSRHHRSPTRSQERRSRYRSSPRARGRPSPDYNEDGGERRRGRSRSRSRTRRR